jgi:metallo-beta-lactamase family protein
VELWLDSGADTVEPVFSGDLGRSGMPILQAPVSVPRVDLVIMESTCRDCVHRSWPHTLQEFGEVLNGAPP